MRYAFTSDLPNAGYRWQALTCNPPPRIGVDTETPSLTDISLLGIGIAFNADESFYLTADDPDIGRVWDLLRSKAIRKVYHNAPFDLRVLRQYNVDIDEVDDTALMARLDMKPSAVLEDISYIAGVQAFDIGRFQTESAKTILTRYKAKSFNAVPTEVVATKCCKDATACLLLYNMFSGNADWYHPQFSMSYYEKQRRLIATLEQISRQGIKLDQARRQKLEDYYQTQVSRYQSIAESYGCVVTSPKQVGEFLCRVRGNFLPPTEKGGQVITDDAHLSKLTDPFAQLILAYRKHAKQLSTYILPLANQDRAYTLLKMEAATGRLNSGRPSKASVERNLQNISKNSEIEFPYAPYTIRSMFIPDTGIFTKVDKSQVELRILAELANDPLIKAVYAVDGDFHEDTKVRLNTTRVFAKNINYGLVYGGGAAHLADVIGTQDVKAVQVIIDKWMQTYTATARWFKETERFGAINGYIVTRGGRKIRLPTEMGEAHVRNCCRNYPIQGSAAEDIIELMLHPFVQEYIDVTRLQVHDELIQDGDIIWPEMTLNEKDSWKEHHIVYDIKGELARLSGIYLPLKVEKVSRWG